MLYYKGQNYALKRQHQLKEKQNEEVDINCFDHDNAFGLGSGSHSRKRGER